MKHFLILLFVMASLPFIISCSSDDPEPEPESKNYLPIAEDNEWVYEYVLTTDVNTTQDRDTTKIGENSVIDGITYREWSPVLFLFGFANSIFVRKDGDFTYFKNPDIVLGFDEFISIPPFIMIDDNSNPGSLLDSFETEREFTPIPVPDTLGLTGTITPKIYVTATSNHKNTFDQTTLNGEPYQDVYENLTLFTIQVDLIASMSASGIPVNITHTWIPEQEYGELKTWYANDIGLARSQVSVGIENVDNTVDVPILGEVDLEELGITLDDFLSINNATGVAELVSYELN